MSRLFQTYLYKTYRNRFEKRGISYQWTFEVILLLAAFLSLVNITSKSNVTNLCKFLPSIEVCKKYRNYQINITKNYI